MKIVICWTHLSGYMAASWRALAAVPGVSVFVVAFTSESVAPFDAGLLGGIPYRLLDDRERHDAALVTAVVRAEKPDAVHISGWNFPAYRAVAADPELANAAKLMAMDTQLRFDLRQAVGRRVMRSYFRRIDRVTTSGARAAECARYLGFRRDQIRVGFCGIDFGVFGGLLERRIAAGPWPRKFLFVGRYVKEKALDVLADGYARYRAAAGANAWELVCSGRGPEAATLRAPGITDLGFVPPDRQAAVFADAGALVMASSYEPWSVATVEGAAAGLPMVCSDACGAVVEVVRAEYNGYVFATGDAAMLADRLMRVTKADLPLWGRRARGMAEAFSADTWPQRMFDGLLPAASPGPASGDAPDRAPNR